MVRRQATILEKRRAIEGDRDVTELNCAETRPNETRPNGVLEERGESSASLHGQAPPLWNARRSMGESEKCACSRSTFDVKGPRGEGEIGRKDDGTKPKSRSGLRFFAARSSTYGAILQLHS